MQKHLKSTLYILCDFSQNIQKTTNKQTNSNNKKPEFEHLSHYAGREAEMGPIQSVIQITEPTILPSPIYLFINVTNMC